MATLHAKKLLEEYGYDGYTVYVRITNITQSTDVIGQVGNTKLTKDSMEDPASGDSEKDRRRVMRAETDAWVEAHFGLIGDLARRERVAALTV